MPVTLKSRLPEISTAIPLKVGAVIHAETEKMAADAQERARSQYQGSEPFHIEAGEGNVKGQGTGYGILASWYWFFGEFGTSHQPARPYMLPAVEAGKDKMVEEIRATLEKL